MLTQLLRTARRYLPLLLLIFILFIIIHSTSLPPQDETITVTDDSSKSVVLEPIIEESQKVLDKYFGIDKDMLNDPGLDKVSSPIPASTILRPCGPQLSKNTHFADRAFWSTLSKAKMKQKRQEWKLFISQRLPLFDYDSFRYRGRGIVYTASGHTLNRALASIRLLKSYKVQLPIEIWYIQGEIDGDVLKRTRMEFQDGSVRFRDLAEEQRKRKEFADFRIDHAYGSSRNYHIKTLVLLLCQFQNVLYLDSDNMPLRDPTLLFDSDAFKSTGKYPMDHPMWEITERPCEDEWEQESGQLLIDKQRGWRALLISLFFQRDHDFYFKIILGDKDTFRFGWKLAGTAYHMIKQPVAIGGRVRQGRFCGHSMIQFDPSGEALFVHTTALKTTNAVKSGQTWEAIQYFDATAPRKVKASEDGQLAYAGGYPVVNEYAGGQHKSKEEGGVGQETLPNPCLDLAIHNVTTHTFPSVVDGLGLQGAIDSYRVVLEDFSTYKGGKYADFESMYYKFGGPDSGDAEYCGNGFKGNSKCRDPNDCCSAWGYCGQTVDHCGVGCSGGNCFNKRPRPTKTPSKDFVYCGNGVLGSGFCPKEKDCCSRFGWCGNDRDMCSKANCVSGPCLS